MNCPLCGFQDAYIGFIDIECKNIECKKYKADDGTKKENIAVEIPKESFSKEARLIIKNNRGDFYSSLTRCTVYSEYVEIDFSFPRNGEFLTEILNLSTDRNENNELLNESEMCLKIKEKNFPLKGHLIDNFSIKVNEKSEVIHAHMITRELEINNIPCYWNDCIEKEKTEQDEKNNPSNTFSFEIKNCIQTLYTIGLYPNTSPGKEMFCGKRLINLEAILGREKILNFIPEFKINETESMTPYSPNAFKIMRKDFMDF